VIGMAVCCSHRNYCSVLYFGFKGLWPTWIIHQRISFSIIHCPDKSDYDLSNSVSRCFEAEGTCTWFTWPVRHEQSVRHIPSSWIQGYNQTLKYPWLGSIPSVCKNLLVFTIPFIGKTLCSLFLLLTLHVSA
jgi:hypothetical protein